jgi:predicted ABC-type ATPase
MQRHYSSFKEMGHDLIRHQPPKQQDTADKLDAVRTAFHMLIDDIEQHMSYDQDSMLAARSIHRACQDVIFAIVHNQEED